MNLYVSLKHETGRLNTGPDQQSIWHVKDIRDPESQSAIVALKENHI